MKLHIQISDLGNVLAVAAINIGKSEYRTQYECCFSWCTNFLRFSRPSPVQRAGEAAVARRPPPPAGVLITIPVGSRGWGPSLPCPAW